MADANGRRWTIIVPAAAAAVSDTLYPLAYGSEWNDTLHFFEVADASGNGRSLQAKNEQRHVIGQPGIG